MKNVRVRDQRMPPFCWQDKAVLRLIHSAFKKSEIATALAVYTTLTMYASNNGSDEFQIRRQKLADFIGRSVDCLDRYLAQFEELSLIEKAPLSRDGWYRCLDIQLLGCPDEPSPNMSDQRQGMTAPVQEVAAPIRPPGAADTATPPHPQGNLIEEKNLEKKVPSDTASPPAPRTKARAAKRSSTPSKERTPSPAKEHVGETAHDMQSPSGMSGMLVPGEVEAGEKNGRLKSRKAKQNKLHAFDPTKPPEDWSSKDALNYFRQHFAQAHPQEPTPSIQKKDMAIMRDRLDWLDESVGRATIKAVIDYIFGAWDSGLRDRLRWTRTCPGFGLIQSQRYLETLIDEARNGVARRKTHDEYDAGKAKQSAEQADDRGWPSA
jgi:hypothetical protein